ncbi:MAG: hypothetical protein ABL871_02735 [Terricaulis sp.]
MMRSVSVVGAATVAVLLALSQASGQESEPVSQADLVVTGVRPEQIQTFVEQVSAVPPSVRQIARWDDDICFTVAGLPTEQGQAIVDRVSQRAEMVGLHAGREGCRPNVFVFFASDADGFTRQLVDRDRSLFAYLHEENVVTLGQEALRSFVDTPRAVRWWHVAQTRGADGDRLGSDQVQSTAPPPPNPEEMKAGPDGFSGVQAVRSQGTRVRAVERQDFNRVVIIVDGQKAGGYPLDGIADYISMVTLAQIDPAAQTRDYPTILNLFADDPDVVSFEMTNWDLAYLDGLYRSTRNSASVTQQMRDISRRMSGDRGS